VFARAFFLIFSSFLRVARRKEGGSGRSPGFKKSAASRIEYG
jgi:hypothetical protein